MVVLMIGAIARAWVYGLKRMLILLRQSGYQSRADSSEAARVLKPGRRSLVGVAEDFIPCIHHLEDRHIGP